MTLVKRGTLRTEEIFVREVGESLNAVMRDAGRWIYKDVCQRISKAMLVAGIGHIRPFDRPVELWFYPKLGPKRRAFDASNYAVAVKAIEDRLVWHGILREDAAGFVYGIHTMRPVRADNGIEGIVVRIVECDAPTIPKPQALELSEAT